MAFGKFIWFLVYLVFGFYLINYSFQFYPIKEFFPGMNSYIILIGGVLVILGGINYLRIRSPYSE